MRTIVLPIESSRGSGRSLLTGIINYSRLHGPWSFHWQPAGLGQILPILKEMNIDGIIMRDSEEVNKFLQLNIPIVIVRHSQDEMPGQINIITDSKAIGNLAAEHLLDRGFGHFAFCGMHGVIWSLNRCEVFARRMRGLGFEPLVFGLEPFDQWDQEQHALVEWIKRLPKPIGMMCCNDDRGHQVAQICKASGIHVPDEIALIGVDDDKLVCELSDPPLSSVSLNFERAGFEGAAQLDRLMSGRELSKTNIIVEATHIVTRQSTDVNAIEDPDVVAALNFIRGHAHQSIRVGDVAATVPLTRRGLEKKFRKAMNRSILDEIRRARINHIAQMLVETNYSVLQIALSLGFDGAEHISRYFKKEKGMSLLQFRKKYGKK